MCIKLQHTLLIDTSQLVDIELYVRIDQVLVPDDVGHCQTIIKIKYLHRPSLEARHS